MRTVSIGRSRGGWRAPQWCRRVSRVPTELRLPSPAAHTDTDELRPTRPQRTPNLSPSLHSATVQMRQHHAESQLNRAFNVVCAAPCVSRQCATMTIGILSYMRVRTRNVGNTLTCHIKGAL